VKIETVIFDLDGTITRPVLDFDQIRAEIGGISGPILEALEEMGPQERNRAEDILGRHEAHAAEHSQLNPGVHDVCNWLRGRRLLIGLVTRNQRRSVEQVCRKHDLAFDSIVTREDGPAKPDPFPVQHACEMMGVLSEQAVVVGDYLFDLLVPGGRGRRACCWPTGSSVWNSGRRLTMSLPASASCPRSSRR